MLDRSTRETDDSSPDLETSVSKPAGSVGQTRRPVRSEFARLGPTFALRRVVSVAIALVVLGGALYVTLGLGRHNQPQEVPVIKADGDYKQKPEEPGGIDIPHQDVQVYQKLDQQGGEAAQAEHLLPQAETPQEQLMPSGGATFSDNAAIEAAHLPPTVDNAQVNSGRADSEAITAPLPGAPAGEDSITSAGQAASSPDAVGAGVNAPVSASVSAPSVPVATASSPISSSVVSGTAAVVARNTHVAPHTAPTASNSVATVKPVAVVASPAHAPTPPAMAQSTTAPVVPSVAKEHAWAESVVPDEALASVSASAPKIGKTVAPSSRTVSSTSSGVASVSGGRRGVVQLASFPDMAVAEQSVEKIQTRYASYLGGAKLHVVRADLGAKGIYYRIQSQSMAESQAKEICSSLKRLNAGCILVRP